MRACCACEFNSGDSHWTAVVYVLLHKQFPELGGLSIRIERDKGQVRARVMIMVRGVLHEKL